MFTSDKQDNNLLSRAEDIVNLSQLRHKPCFLGFLNEREQYLINSNLSYAKDNIYFFGGYDNAVRKFMCASEYEPSSTDYPIKKLCYKFRQEDGITHRDFLGSLMGLGIERSCIGDIILQDGFAVVFAKDDISGYIELNLLKVGRTGVKLIPEKDCKLSYKQNFEELTCIVSSMRLDAVVAALAGVSRGKSSMLISSGKVFTNYCENTNVSFILKPEDVLTIRGKGKYIIKEQSSTTKKGRLKIIIYHYR